MMKVVFLRVTTWVGSTNPYYERRPEHYYGTLVRYCTKTEVEVQYVLSEGDARRLSKDDYSYRAGEMSGRFFSKEYLIECAKHMFAQRFPDCHILIEGDPVTLDPRPVLTGPADYMKRANDLVARAEANDWWEGDEKVMRAISKEWDKLQEEFGVSR